MKILLVNQFYYPFGGAERMVKMTSDLLEQHGHSIAHFSIHNIQNFYSPYEQYFIPEIAKNNSLSQRLKAIKRMFDPWESRLAIRRLIHEQGPFDIAHLNMMYYQISPAIIFELKRHGIPIVMTLHDFSLFCCPGTCWHNKKVCDRCKIKSFFYPLIGRCLYGSFSKSLCLTILKFWYGKIRKIFDKINIFISPSQFLLKKNLEFGLQSEIVHIPNFIQTKAITPQYSWQERSIVYFGRVVDYKGVKTLVNAVIDLDVTLKIIGIGFQEQHLKDLIQKRNQNNVKFLGFMSGKDLYDEIKKSMFVVVPSEWWEPFSITTIEAFALGKPVVGSNIGGIVELIANQVNGLLFNPGDENELHNTLLNLVNNPDQIIAMGKRARLIAEQKYSETVYYEKLISVYQRAIKHSNS